MKKLVIFLLSIFLYNISSAQSGWGYVNYTSYKTHAGNGSTSQYGQFANTAADFVTMFNTTNTNTTITHTGEVTLATMTEGSFNVPRWNSDYFGYKFEFYFIPQETGTYRFGVNSDDASDLLVDGVVVTSFYGGHGASGYQYGSINLIAGNRYFITARTQEYGGGEAFYLRWSRPSAPNTYSYWTNEVTNISSIPSKRVVSNFNFNTNLDATKFSFGSIGLSSAGKVEITNSIDSVKVNNGFKALTTTGQAEWCVIYGYDTYNQRYRIGIDSREVNGIINEPSKISSLQLFDLWDGPVTFNSYDPNGWTEVYVYTNTQFNFAGSSYSANIRNGGFYYALTAEFTFSALQTYKPQSISLSTINNLTTLYNNIVTVSDVWLAFKEVANIGLFGNQTGNEFIYGMQYKNADVNEDGYLNETDAFLLLQHLTGKKNLVDTFNLNKTLRIIPQSTYNQIGKSNWNTFTTPLGSSYSFDINTGKSIDTLNFAIGWKGDANLSHSSTPISNSITTMSVKSMNVSNQINASIITELVGDSVTAYITIDPLGQELVGTQLQLNYDNSLLKFSGISYKTKGNPNNYGTDKGDYINLGSLITDGGILDNTTEYKISFKPQTKLDNILGLISVGFMDAVNKSGRTLKVIMK